MSAAKTAANDKTTYDEVPYDSFPYTHTHPDHMAMVASLFGMEHVKPAQARVLEIGCAGGGNIIPLALRYPKATFTGIDLSQKQIDTANDMKKALELKNITFEAQDIMAFDIKKHKGAFDYIICHGVYSWVPEKVAARVLEICNACLSDNGFALVSYNTLPGWNAVRSVAEMMRFHTGRFQQPKQKVTEARKLLQFLSETAPEGSSYKSIIEEEKQHLVGANDSYLYHDHLESTNRQFYLHEFAAELKKNGLDYVGDAAVSSMFVENLPPKAMQALKALNDIILQEQYIDFILNRRFRSSIICKQGRAINRNIRPQQILDYCLVANMKPETDNPDFNKPVKFQSRSGKSSFTSNMLVAGTLYNEICKSGAKPIPAKEVIARTAKITGKPIEQVRARLLENGLQLALRGFLLLYSDSPEYVETLSAKPVVYKLARLQAQRRGCTHVTNQLGQSVPVKGIAEKVIPLLDGTHNIDAVVAKMVEEALAGRIIVREDNKDVKDKAVLAEKLRKNVVNIFAQLAQKALLTA